jgi:hypothetical protein
MASGEFRIGLGLLLQVCCRMTCDGLPRNHLVDANEVLFRKPDVRGLKIFFEVLPALGSDQSDNIFPLAHHPRDAELRKRDSFFVCERPQSVNEAHVFLQVGCFETGKVTAKIAFVQC